MSEHIIDTAMAKRLAAAGAIHGVAIVGQPGGWSVMLIFGKTEKPLGAQRTDKPRLWRSLDRCIEYLKSELHIRNAQHLGQFGRHHDDRHALLGQV
ncbi:MAG: hypothetical protein ABIT83_17125, partial [Massilia sp.]